MKEKQTLKIGKYRLNLNTLVFLLGIAGILLIGLSSLLPRGEKAAEKPESSLSPEETAEIEALLERRAAARPAHSGKEAL